MVGLHVTDPRSGGSRHFLVLPNTGSYRTRVEFSFGDLLTSHITVSCKILGKQLELCYRGYMEVLYEVGFNLHPENFLDTELYILI